VPSQSAGFDEVLYREAEVRRQRQQRREEEAWILAQQQSRPKLGRNSRALCQNRLERELRGVFLQLLHHGTDSLETEVGEVLTLRIPRSGLASVLQSLGLLGEVGEEEEFCMKLCYLLDREDTGTITFERLLGFLNRSLDREGLGQSPRPQAASLEEECFWQLEQELSRNLGRLLPNRHTRPKSPGHSASPSPAASARSFPAFPSEGVAEGTSVRTRAEESANASPRRASSAPRYSAPARPQSAPSSREAVDTPRSKPLSARARKAASLTGQGVQGEAHTISRCHLLYHQAVFASKESAQLEEEIKALRQREEMRECTFRPKLLASSRRSSSTPAAQPRNFENAVARMRNAHQQRLRRQEEHEHIPCGENYERLRRLGTRPFSFYSKEKPRAQDQAALMYIDVNVGNGRTGRIKVREGDNLRTLSRNFARTYQLDRDMTMQLECMLQEAYSAQSRANVGIPLAPRPAEPSADAEHPSLPHADFDAGAGVAQAPWPEASADVEADGTGTAAPEK